MRTGRNIGAALVLCSVWRGAALITDSYIGDLIGSFLGEMKWSAAILFTCLDAAGEKWDSKLLIIVDEFYLLRYNAVSSDENHPKLWTKMSHWKLRLNLNMLNGVIA
jgi:hypothetical protein